jgi:hypothetical protein
MFLELELRDMSRRHNTILTEMPCNPLLRAIFGTIKYRIDGNPLDITNYLHEILSDGAKIKIETSIERI